MFKKFFKHVQFVQFAKFRLTSLHFYSRVCQSSKNNFHEINLHCYAVSCIHYKVKKSKLINKSQQNLSLNRVCFLNSFTIQCCFRTLLNVRVYCTLIIQFERSKQNFEFSKTKFNSLSCVSIFENHSDMYKTSIETFIYKRECFVPIAICITGQEVSVSVDKYILSCEVYSIMFKDVT